MADAFTRDYSTADELDLKIDQYHEVCIKLKQKEERIRELEMVIAVARLVDKENLRRFAYDKELRTALAALEEGCVGDEKNACRRLS